MSKPSAHRPNQKPAGLQQFADAIGKAAKQRAEQMNGETSDVPEPSGQLPIPDAQVVFPDRYEWTWEAIIEEIHVRAIKSRGKDADDQGWHVTLDCVHPNMKLTPDESKLLGEALLAAWNYQYVWKDNFADMFENGLEVKPLYTDQYKNKSDKEVAESFLPKTTPKKRRPSNPVGGTEVSSDGDG